MAHNRWRFGIRDKFIARGLNTGYKIQKEMNKANPADAMRLLNADRKQITIDTINELCEFFGCAPGDLFVADKARSKK